MKLYSKYKVINKKKFRNASFISIFTMFLVVFFITFAFLKVYSENKVEYKRIIIEQGDTLWNIALEYNTNQNIRSYIHKIKSINNINNNYIYPGQIIYVPIISDINKCK